MSKLTIEQKLARREIKKPNGLIYGILMLVVRILNRRLHTEFTYKACPGKDEGPIVLISNHASRNDYLFTAPAALPKRLNYVVGYNEFFRFPTNLMLRVMQVIPKRNFTPDLYTVQKIFQVIRSGGNICIMPEGMSSITGMAQPVIPGGAKLLKKLGVSVYYTKISGAYLTYTKHCLDERIGRCEVVVDRMFTPEELKTMSVEEIEDRMNRLLAHDDYIWNRTAHVRYKGKGQMAKNLDTLLYLCPKCGAMYQMQCEGNRMSCTACGNTVELNEYYELRPASESDICPSLVTDWTIAEREKAARDVREEGFRFEEHVRIGKLPDHKLLTGDATSIICGEGTLRLTAEGLTFTGTKDGNPYEFFQSAQNLPTFGMCTDITRFYTFDDGKFVEFFPDGGDVLRWDHLVEEMHRYRGGKWQNTEYRHHKD